MAQTVGIRAAATESARDLPGTRAWFDALASKAGFTWETPELDADLLTGTQPEALFKLPEAGEPVYKRILALIHAISRVTPGWTWTVRCDIEGTGTSWLGPVEVSFTNGNASAAGVDAYCGSRLWTHWDDLAAPPPPETPSPALSGPQPGELWMQLDGPDARDASEDVGVRMMSLPWTFGPPRRADQPNSWFLTRYADGDITRFITVARSVTRKRAARAHLSDVDGVFALHNADTPISSTSPAPTGPGNGLAPELLDTLVERPFGDEGQRAWFVQDVLVALLLSPKRLAVEGPKTWGWDKRHFGTPLPMWVGASTGTAAILHVRKRASVAAQRARAISDANLADNVAAALRTVLAGQAPPVDAPLVEQMLVTTVPDALDPVFAALWRSVPNAVIAQHGAGWLRAPEIAPRYARAVKKAWPVGSEDALRLFARRSRVEGLNATIAHHARDPRCWRAALARVEARPTDAPALDVLRRAIDSPALADALRPWLSSDVPARAGVARELLGVSEPEPLAASAQHAGPAPSADEVWPRGVLLLATGTPGSRRDASVAEAVKVAATLAWPVPPQLSDTTLFFPLPDGTSQEDARRVALTALVVAAKASRKAIRKLHETWRVHDTTCTLGRQVDAVKGSFDKDHGYWSSAIDTAGLRRLGLPKETHSTRPPSPWPNSYDGDRVWCFDYKARLPTLWRHHHGPPFARIEGGRLLVAAFDTPDGGWREAACSLERVYEARNATVPFHQRLQTVLAPTQHEFSWSAARYLLWTSMLDITVPDVLPEPIDQLRSLIPAEDKALTVYKPIRAAVERYSSLLARA